MQGGVLYVTKEGSDTTGDGRSWETAFATINKAVATLGNYPGKIYIGPGRFQESIVLDHEGQTLHGTSRRFIYGTVLEAPDETSDILTIRAVDCGASDIQFMGKQGTLWDGTALLLDHAGYCFFDRLSFRQGNGTATALSGGVAIHIIESEGWRFTDVGIGQFRRAIFLDTGATEGTFIDTMCSSNWEDLIVQDTFGTNTPGGTQFHRFKAVGTLSDRPVRIEGGGHIFINADWNESLVNGNRVEITSDSNIFIRGAGSPESDWIVSGDGNIFMGFTILRRLVLAGNGTLLDNAQLIGDELRIEGDDTRIRGFKHFGGTVTILGTGTIIEGAPDGVPISGSYHRPVIEQVTGSAQAPPPETTIDFTVTQGADPATFTFEASSSASSPRYDWKFGESAPEIQVDASGQTVTHTFASPGPKNVRVTAVQQADNRLLRSTVKTIQAGLPVTEPPPTEPPPTEPPPAPESSMRLTNVPVRLDLASNQTITLENLSGDNVQIGDYADLVGGGTPETTVLPGHTTQITTSKWARSDGQSDILLAYEGLNTTPAGSSSSSVGLIPSRSQGLIFNDVLTPVVAEGIGLGVAQSQGADERFFVLTGNFRQVVGVLGSDLLDYAPSSSMVKASLGVWEPGASVWTPTTEGTSTADDDKAYGLPGVSALATRIGLFGGSAHRRLTQRWYTIPGIPDVLFLEVQLAIDASATDGTATGSKTAGSGAAPYAPNFDLMFEAQPWSSGGGIALDYDADLDGIAFINGSGQTNGNDYLYHFARCISDPSTGYYYDDAATPDADQNFASGALPAGAQYTTVGSTTYRAHLSVTPEQVQGIHYTVRFAVGVGTSLAAAKAAVTNVPNQGPAQTIGHYESKVAALPAPSNLANDEAQAWGYFAYTPIFNSRGEGDWHPEQAVWDGTPRRLTFAGLGRWNAVWTFDTALGLMGMSELDPALVRDFLDYLLNNVMNQATGFLRRDPTTTTQTSLGNFYLARLARRYLAATGDLTFLTALYPKLKLNYEWWTETASSAYRHPNWPTVKLLTASAEHETQEAGAVTANGNYPAGDDWLTATAYDFCVHMAYLAGVTGNPDDVAFWNSEAAAYKSAIQTYCWDSAQGWFQPVMTPSSPSGGQADSLGRYQEVMTYRAFSHLWAGTATPAQAQIMRDKLVDPAIFSGTYGIRTVDKRWVGYLPNDWVRGGSRPYFDAMVSTGLRRYGFDADADAVLQTWIDRQNAVGTTPEMTNPDTGAGGFARFLLAGVMLVEATLAKRMPELLGVDDDSSSIGVDPVT